MSGDGKDRNRASLSVDVEPELRRRIKVAAAQKDLSVRDYVVTILRRALEAEEQGEGAAEDAAWSRLSARSFARDWGSGEDEGYDGVS